MRKDQTLPVNMPQSYKPDDDALERLLKAVAKGRDQSAFRELTGAIGRSSYNLALQLCGNSTLAEESVQEALLQIWKFADRFDPGRGTARAWIMRIVANMALNAKAKEAREKMAMRRRSSSENFDLPVQEETGLEFEELNAKLRSLVDSLPILERQIISLYYGTDLSQYEIADALSIPQRTVSYRINSILDHLRSSLAGAGFAASLPVVDRAYLAETILDSRPIPSGLQEKIFQGLSKFSGRASRVASQAWWRISVMGMVVVVAGIAATVGIFAVSLSLPPEASPTEKLNPDSAKKPISPVQPTSTRERSLPFTKTWNFDSAEVSGMRIIEGGWHWIPDGGPDRSGCMEIDTELFTAELDVPNLDKAYIVSFSGAPIYSTQEGGFRIGAFVSATRSAALFFNIGKADIRDRKSAKWNEYRDYVSSGSIDSWVNGGRSTLLTFERMPHARIVISARGRHRIDTLRITEADPAALPDVSKYLNALMKIPPDRRVGSVILPGLRGERDTTRPVTVEFLGESSFMTEGMEELP